MSAKLKRKIGSKKARIAVFGLGYVGLPLAVNFAKAGFSVFGIDKNRERVGKLKKKISYISDVPKKDIVKVLNSGKLKASFDFDVLTDIDVIIICVPTPLKRKYTPDITYIFGAVKTIREHLCRETLVVLESTTYPGTTEELIKPELEKSGLKAGKDFYLAFSPERIDPGNKTYDLTKIPKVVGGYTKKCGEMTALLYSKIIKNVHSVSSAKAAEMTKLLENSFRIINIGWINEVAMMCHKMDVDIWEVIDAAKTKPFGYMAFYPGLGVGGHCIPDDPLYLYWKARHHGFNSKYLKLSSDTNLSMPVYAVNRIKEVFRKRKKKFRGSRILVVGVTYKKDVKDLRKSPPLALIEILKDKGVRVDYYDPVIPYLDIGKIKMDSKKLNANMLRRYDCVVIACDHTNVNYGLIAKHAKLVYDIKNVYSKKRAKNIVRF